MDEQGTRQAGEVKMKIVIIGGVAAGASTATRARRIDENAEIIMFERGEYVSFANCGLPYYVGNVIKQREALFVTKPSTFKKRFNIDVRISEEVVSIDTAAKQVSIRKTKTGERYQESYDKLVITTGASPVKIDFPGADLPEVVSFWTVSDMDRINKIIEEGAKKVTVVGAGFVGMELVENFIYRKLSATLIHRSAHVMSAFMDPEMAQPIKSALAENNVRMVLDSSIEKVSRPNDGSASGVLITLKDGSTLESDLVVVCTGVKPNSALAKESGLELGGTGGIKVNECMQTSNPDVYAGGDAVEVKDFITHEPKLKPLAGPANKQGRIIADNIFGANKKYNGTLGTSICKIFDLTVASVGLTEKQLIRNKTAYLKTYLLPFSHATHYPGAEQMYIKLLFNNEGGILGVQISGNDGVDKRIDIMATAIRNGLKIQDLAELELAYAPPYGSARDPVNHAGFVAENIINGFSRVVTPDEIPADSFLIDVREPEEFEAGAIPGATNIPLGSLRENYVKIPKEKSVIVHCKVGVRGYIAERILRQKGFDVRNLSGGYLVWKLFNPSPRKEVSMNSGNTQTQNATQAGTGNSEVRKLSVCGLQCPGPIVQVKTELSKMAEGEVLNVTANDPGFYNDLPSWCQATGNKLVSIKKDGRNIEAVISKGLTSQAVAAQGSGVQKKGVTIVLFSNDLDKAMAAFIIAIGFATIGQPVSIFFTFWGLNVLRKDNPPEVKKDLISRMFGMMMPRGAKKLVLSKMHMMGMGTAMMKRVMASKNVSSLPALIAQARAMGITLLACEMAMNLMGIKHEELLDSVEVAGVAKFAALSAESNSTLFI